MDSNRFALLGEIFGEARDLRPDERAAYLREACGDDAELRIEVEELLAEDAHQTGDVVDRALGADDEFERAFESARLKQIGKYRILSICGSGGMGTVYEAKQDAPARHVALKVIQAGALREDLLRRFRRETEILARLQHPGIAQIFEAGEFEHEGTTRPFFAMEFVDGLPLTTFAQKLQLDVAARIDLFLQVCEAIHYAHGQGVVHRDIKPDNIFVQESSGATTSAAATSGQPKVLDFGVARVTDADAQISVATNAGTLLGSVLYMSPEQASGKVDQIDARSDLYSLGVVLFELLSGKLPYDVHQRPLGDALHAILHDEPTRLGAADPALRGDLDTILGKCLEKDKGRRYDTVAALAEDLRRFQQVKPITARPPSTWYQLQKFTQRNRALVGGAAGTALALIVGAIVAVIFALQSNENARVAEENEARSERAAYRANISAASALLETDPAQARRILSDIRVADRGWEHRYLDAALSGLLLEFGEVAPRDPGRYKNRATSDMYLLADGEHVVARRSADEFCVWETRTGRVVRTFLAPADVDLFAVSASGSLMAVGLTSGRVVVGDPRDAAPTWETWDEGDAPFDALAVDPAGTSIAIDRADGLRFGRPGAWHTLDSEAQRSPFLPARLAYSPDSSQLAWVFGGVRIFDCATGEEVREQISSDQGHWCIDYAPDGSRIMAGQFRREIRAFDPESGSHDVELLGHNSSVKGVAYGSSNQLLSFANDDTLRVWNIEDRAQTAIFVAPDTAKAVFLDEDHILSLTGGKFRLWQLDGRRARELIGQQGHVFAAQFSGDGSLLATSAPWADLVVWDPLETFPLRSTPAERRVQFAFNATSDDLIASYHRWSGHDFGAPWPGGEVTALLPTARGPFHAGRRGTETLVDGCDAPASPDGLFVHRNEHRMGPNAAQPAAFLDGAPLPLTAAGPPALTPHIGENPLLAFGGLRSWEFTGPIVEWICFGGALSDAEADTVDTYLAARLAGKNPEFPTLRDAPPLLAHFRATEDTVERDEEGDVLGWTAQNDPDLRLFARGQPHECIQYHAAEADLPARVQFYGAFGTHRWLEAALPEVVGAEQLTICWLGGFGPGGGTQTAYSIGELQLAYADQDLHENTGKVGPYLSFSRDGRRVADSWSEEIGGPATVRDRATGHVVAYFPGSYWGVDLHPDSRRLACAGNDGTIDVFDVVTGERLAHFEAHSSECFDLAFSPDGTRLASCGNDNALRLWDTTTFEPLLELPGHRSYVRGVAWSPDSTMLASACGDYTVRVWDSVSRVERYAQVLANRALEDKVRAEVEAIHAAQLTPEAALAELRRRWPDDAGRRHAAMKVLARLQP